MRFLLAPLLVASAHMALAETLVPTRTIRAREIIAPEDLTWMSSDVPGAISDLDEVLGMEARVSLYAGRPISPADIGPPALIDRNQIVIVEFTRGGLSISTEARALNRAAAGEAVRLMNINSRATVLGIVSDDGTIRVK